MAVWQQFQQAATTFFFNNSNKATGVILGLGLVAIAPMCVSAMPAADATGSTHLYGTTEQADQIGHDYIILRFVDTDQIEGAVYQINSEFACFSGELDQGKLNLAIIDPYEQIAYDYQLNYQESQPIAEAGDRLTTKFVPEGYYAIPSPSDLAMDVFSACMNEESPDI